jgi:hypothetical protein
MPVLDLIPMKGNPQRIIEKVPRTDAERRMDVISSSNIVYKDLVFTLSENGMLYVGRPVVTYVDGELKAVANIAMLRALKEAGVQETHFDYLAQQGQNIPLERLMQQTGFEFQKDALDQGFVDRFLFFANSPRNPVSIPSSIIPNDKNNHSEYVTRNCLRFSIPVGSLEDERNLVINSIESNGPLRSINGISGLGPHREYFQ